MIKCEECGKTDFRGQLAVEHGVSRVYEVVTNAGDDHPMQLRETGDLDTTDMQVSIRCPCGAEVMLTSGEELEFLKQAVMEF